MTFPTDVSMSTMTGPAPAVTDSERDGSAPVPWREQTTANRFTDQTVIVTGAGSGIGRATASRVAREGGRVIAVDLSRARLDDLLNAHPDAGIRSICCDISNDAAIVEILGEAGGRIDALANVAGVMDDMTPVGEVSDAVWERLLRVNVTAPMKLMRAVLPGMLERGGGAIVNVASEAALRGSCAGAAYTTAKHALVGLTKNSAFMYGPSGIRVNAVAPGATATNIEVTFASPLGAQRVQDAMAVMPPVAQAEQVAASITFLLSDDAVNINGAVLPSDGGWSVA